MMEGASDMTEQIGEVRNEKGPLQSVFTGRLVPLLAPDKDDIDIVDIAHALSLQCRYLGHTWGHYSVAQHSVHVHDLVRRLTSDPDIRMAALLHDAHEAYLGDWSSPTKAAFADLGFGDALAMLEAPVIAAIRKRFGVVQVWEGAFAAPIIKYADIVALATEKRDVTTARKVDWGWLPPPDVTVICPCQPVQAEGLFLTTFKSIERERA
jgi:uncharacterized protein